LCRKGFFHFAANAKAKPLLNAIKAPGGSLAHANVDFIFGECTWMDTDAAHKVAASLGQRASFAIIPSAGK
jgi:hypothetical protein